MVPCNSLWFFVVLCGSLWYIVVLCGKLQLFISLQIFAFFCESCNPLWFFGLLRTFGYLLAYMKPLNDFRRLFFSKFLIIFFLLCIWESFMKDSLILTVVLSPPWLPHRVSKPLMTNIRYSPANWSQNLYEISFDVFFSIMSEMSKVKFSIVIQLCYNKLWPFSIGLLSLFYDLTRDSISNNFVIDVCCSC